MTFAFSNRKTQTIIQRLNRLTQGNAASSLFLKKLIFRQYYLSTTVHYTQTSQTI